MRKLSPYKIDKEICIQRMNKIKINNKYTQVLSENIIFKPCVCIRAHKNQG